MSVVENQFDECSMSLKKFRTANVVTARNWNQVE